MDLCHCVHPKVPEGTRKGQCGWCNLYYDYNSWRKDSRVRAARKEIAAISTENIVREIRPPSVEPYSPCPCGSGKKLKFCCRTIVAALDKTILNRG